MYNVYFISYPAFWTEDRKQMARLGGMARFSLAPYFPSLSQHTNTIQTQNQYSTQTEQIQYIQNTNTAIAWYDKIFISPILPLFEAVYIIQMHNKYRTNATHKQNKYNTNKEQMPRMARFSLAQILPLIETGYRYNTNTTHKQNKYNTNREQIP